MPTPEDIMMFRRQYGDVDPAMNAYPRFSEIGGYASGVRTFDTGATRSPLGDKLQYEGYLNPLVLKTFAEYMRRHQTQSDGKQRAADNWQQGIPRASLMDSMMRHYMDVWLYHRGYEEEMSEDIIESLCALIFNAMAYLKSVKEE
jgi:hypothetical protein